MPNFISTVARSWSLAARGFEVGGWGRGETKRREEAERFLSSQADHFTGVKWKEKTSACSVRNDGGGWPMCSQERSGKERHRLAPFEMTVGGWPRCSQERSGEEGRRLALFEMRVWVGGVSAVG